MMFSMKKILVALATFNRKNITKLCLENIKSCLDNNSSLIIYDDGSDEYNENFLRKFTKNCIRFRIRGGIERSRARSFRDFFYILKDFDLLYITDNDVIHDPQFLEQIRYFYSISEKSENIMPIGLFNSVFHSGKENQVGEHNKFFIRKTCPGVSQCYDRQMVEKIVNFLNHNPMFETMYGFDYHWPAQLGVPFIQSKISYLEHFARDRHQPGIHSGFSEEKEKIIEDFDRDRALYPTDFLKKTRDQIIKQIMGW